MHDSITPAGAEDARAISRRAALVGALGAVAGGTVLATAAPAAAARPRQVPSAGADPVHRRARFTRHVGAIFPVVDRPGAALRLEGIGDVSDGRGGVAVGHQDAFSLRFRQVRGDALPAGTHVLQHPGLGPVPLFLSPVGRRGRRRHQAVVNRLTVR